MASLRFNWRRPNETLPFKEMPQYETLPFKGRVRVGMGQSISPIPLPASPLKGEEDFQSQCFI
jgi:hypothetical protein